MWLVLWARLVLVRQIATIAAAAAAATAAEAAAAKSVTTAAAAAAATKSAASVVVVAAGRGHAGRRRCGPRGGQAGCVRHPRDDTAKSLR